MKKIGVSCLFSTICIFCLAQTDSLSRLSRDSTRSVDTGINSSDNRDSATISNIDTALRIINVNPFFSVHVDSTLNYQFEINKDLEGYFWYLKNAPPGLHLNKDNGLLSFKADKSYFLSGRLKYDYNYKVALGIQNLSNPRE